MRDSIIAFGENLPGNELNDASNNSTKADLNIVIGSSMRVNPACNLPLHGKQFVLINLQKTPYDNAANVRVWGKCDKFMKMVMDELKIKVEPYDKNENDNDDTLREVSDFPINWESFTEDYINKSKPTIKKFINEIRAS